MKDEDHATMTIALNFGYVYVGKADDTTTPPLDLDYVLMRSKFNEIILHVVGPKTFKKLYLLGFVRDIDSYEMFDF